jgi:hypothetical protein
MGQAQMYWLLAMHNRRETLGAIELGEPEYAAYFARLTAHYARLTRQFIHGAQQ